MRSKLAPLLAAAALAATMTSAEAHYTRAGMRSVGHHHYGMAHCRYGMASNRYGYTRAGYGRYGAAPGYAYGAGYGAGSVAGGVASGVGDVVSAPFDFLGGVFGGGEPEYGTYGYGGAYGAGEPVVAGY